mgnify:CR=1 FL=1
MNPCRRGRHAAGLLLDVPGDRMLVTLHQRRLRRLGDERMLAQILVVGNLLAGDLLGTERIALDRVFVGEASVPVSWYMRL